jgi:hypothetical protein
MTILNFSYVESGTTVTLKMKLWSFLCDHMMKQPISVVHTHMEVDFDLDY